MRRASDLLKGVVSVASLPGVYLRLSAVVSDPRTSAADVGAVIAEDPGLTARLLKLVNSAMYGFPSRIETVSHAISIVGTAQLQDLALATSVIRLFANVPESLVTMESFWRHSVACGVTARALAARRREANVERYFVAGLLHDIGRPIMFMQVPEEARVAVLRSREGGEPLYEVEYALLGFDHSHVGQALLEQWKLPPSLREAVANHHHPDRSQRFPVETAVVHVADLLANALGLGSSGEPSVPPLDPKAWELVGLPTANIGDLLEEAERHYEAAVGVIAQDRT
ncbi:MAG TPA: HDOD domain-containing protein [Gemmatimonadales bacterium]|jgi:putative nucleotidyltransferase with HDIG domain|nr:HDOD domain-containing protein [Gemmatimonadales bacterium]